MFKAKLFWDGETYNMLSYKEKIDAHGFIPPKPYVNRLVLAITQRAFPGKSLIDYCWLGSETWAFKFTNDECAMPMAVELDINDAPDPEATDWLRFKYVGEGINGRSKEYELSEPKRSDGFPFTFELCDADLERLFDHIYPPNIYIKVTGARFALSSDVRNEFTWEGVAIARKIPNANYAREINELIERYPLTPVKE